MKRLVIIACGLIGSFLLSSHGYALPFNTDMNDVQIKTGQIMRPRAEGAISIGSLEGKNPLKLDKKADTTDYQNPKKADPLSIKRGKRLYAVNCTPCHGDMEKWPHEAGVAGKFIGAPDLRADMFYKERTDGSIYGTIHFGGMALMPGYGWKLSPDEHWDIISYLRKAQSDAQVRNVAAK